MAAVAVALAAPLWGVVALLTVATLGELVVARIHVRPTLRHDGPTLPLATLFRYAAPLIVSATCIRLVDRVDLFALRLFGGSMDSVGAYGVAQNLALGPGVFGQAFAPAIIAMLSVRWRRGDMQAARRGAGNTLRLGVLLLPFALLAAGAAPGLVNTFFGDAYAEAAIPFALLGVGATGMLVLSLASSILLAADYTRWTMALTIPALVIALLGHALAVPRFGAVGAAAVSATVGIAGAFAAAALVRTLTGTPLPIASLIRAIPSGIVVGSVAMLWPQRGFLLFAQLAALATMLTAMLVLGGELSPRERTMLLTAANRFRRRRGE
jgi:O-antigen/teichoic acid export membrane protein